MGCHKLTYHQEKEPLPFLGIWKKECLEKNVSQKKDALEEKKWQPVFCVSYYPFGAVAKVWSNPDQTQQETYRHGYQGQYAEKDTTTGWNAFEARMYDPLIGRWLAVDPARQFSSSYLGMGNNPIVHVDEDGRWVNFVVGAVIGGGAELGAQIAINLATGKDWHDIDWVDVGVSTAEGAITSGASAIKNVALKTTVKVVTTATAMATRSAIDYKQSEGLKVFKFDQGEMLNKSSFDASIDYGSEVAALAIDQYLHTGGLARELSRRMSREGVKLLIDGGADLLKDWRQQANLLCPDCQVLDEVLVETQRN